VLEHLLGHYVDIWVLVVGDFEMLLQFHFLKPEQLNKDGYIA